ncbi:MAG: 3-isopropylmalate dehydratase [Negativicutes bacterium]|nr:3-isopropylmalate dehydratase [Negativicutes bacterium]
MSILRGRAWVFGNNVDTDQILPGYAMAEEVANLPKFAMAGSSVPDFAAKVQEGDIIIAGKNFGCGSSREQAPVALKGAGVGLVIAGSFARIFRRNAINIGLPVLVAETAGHIQSGDIIEANLETGEIILKDAVLKGKPLSANTLETIRAGGLINRVRQELGVN